MAGYNHLKGIPELPDYAKEKRKRPKMVALVDEDNCTGCQACVPFCPVDCIEPVAKDKYEFPLIPQFKSDLMNVQDARFVQGSVQR